MLYRIYLKFILATNKMKVIATLIILFPFAVSVLGKEGTPCRSNKDCKKGHFCYDRSHLCAKCLNCTFYNRLPGERPCAQEPSHCGSCLPGYEHELFTDNQVKESCVLSPTTPPTSPPPENDTFWNITTFTFIGIGVGIAVLVVCALFFFIKYICISKFTNILKNRFRSASASYNSEQANNPGYETRNEPSKDVPSAPLLPSTTERTFQHDVPSAPLLPSTSAKAFHPDQVFKENENLNQSTINYNHVERLPPLPDEAPPAYSDNRGEEIVAPIGRNRSIASLNSESTAYPESTSTGPFGNQEQSPSFGSSSSYRQPFATRSSETDDDIRQQTEVIPTIQPQDMRPINFQIHINNNLHSSVDAELKTTNIANAQQGQKIQQRGE